MSQINVNIVAPLGYTGPTLTGDSNFVQVVDNAGDTIIKIPGNDNTAIGKDALNSNTTGTKNIALGTSALESNTTTSYNVAVGHQAMQNSAGKSQSVAIGVDSLKAGASNSVAIGGSAGSFSNNPIVAVGHLALQQSTGTGNTAVGGGAGSQITTGSSNTLIGQGSGSNNLTTGNNNTCLGYLSGGFVDTGDNNTCVGYQAQVSGTGASDEFVLGNINVAVLSCAVTSITSLSDARDKKDIKELPVGLDFVNGLKPVTFTWNDRNEDGKHDIPDFGFIAQDIKKSQEDTGLAETLKLVYENNPEKLQASYGKLVPILVKAIQDLSKEVEILKAK